MDPETIIHLVGGLATAFLAFVGLQIKNAVASNKLEISEKLSDIRMDLAMKHSENQRQAAVHAQSDDGRFDALGKALEKIDRRLDRMEVQ